MKPRLDEQAVRRWLEAESLGQPDEADRLFSALAGAGWGRIDVPSGLAGRVSAALEAVRPPVWWERRWLRAVLLASLASVGAVLAVIPWPDLPSAGVSVLVRWSEALGWMLAWSRAAFQLALVCWDAGAQVSSWVGIVLSAPVPQLLIVLNLAMAVAAFLSLRRLLRAEEMPS